MTEANATLPVTMLRERIGQCPACRNYIWADVSVRVSVGPAHIDGNGKLSAYSSARRTGVVISAHQCEEPTE